MYRSPPSASPPRLNSARCLERSAPHGNAPHTRSSCTSAAPACIEGPNKCVSCKAHESVCGDVTLDRPGGKLFGEMLEAPACLLVNPQGVLRVCLRSAHIPKRLQRSLRHKIAECFRWRRLGPVLLSFTPTSSSAFTSPSW